jgi:hypothetical protein
MSLYNIPITDPTSRKDGKALAQTEIKEIDMLVSTDNGQNYVAAGHAAAGQANFQFDAVDPGTYLFKAQTVDTQTPALVSGDSNVVSLTVAPPVLAAPNAPTLGTPVLA